jgi:predicted hotdog family 3-hydroxylacyl-ACP dehydratase
MLLLDRLLEHDGESTAARVAVGSRGWLKREDGSVPSWLALEYMAQCVAAHEGMLAFVEGRPLPQGFLVAALGLRIYRSRFGADELLRVQARRARGRPGLGALSHVCTVHAEGGSDETVLFAEGRLSVSLPGPSRIGAGPERRP